MSAARDRWSALTVYQQFEQSVVLLLSGLIAIIAVAALWSLMLNVFLTLVLSEHFDPTDHAVFQGVFGMIFTVIIALEFKRSILVMAERKHGLVQVRVVILIAMLAILRKLIILDLKVTGAAELFALATTILALGGVYWLVRDQDRRESTRGHNGKQEQA